MVVRRRWRQSVGRPSSQNVLKRPGLWNFLMRDSHAGYDTYMNIKSLLCIVASQSALFGWRRRGLPNRCAWSAPAGDSISTASCEAGSLRHASKPGYCEFVYRRMRWREVRSLCWLLSSPSRGLDRKRTMISRTAVLRRPSFCYRTVMEKRGCAWGFAPGAQLLAWSSFRSFPSSANNRFADRQWRRFCPKTKGT